jgi:hypothetical protein
LSILLRTYGHVGQLETAKAQLACSWQQRKQ